MGPIVAFDGSNLPVQALRDRMREARADLDAGRAVRGDVSMIYDYEDMASRHVQFQSIVDSADLPPTATLADLHENLHIRAEREAIVSARGDHRMPLDIAILCGGGVLTLSGIGYAAMTAGMWSSGGLAAGAIGLALAATGGLLLRRTNKQENIARQCGQDERYVQQWAHTLIAEGVTAPPPPPQTPADPHHLSIDDKKALLARLRNEIREAEQKREARVERQGDVVAIGGVKLKVRT